MFLFVPYSAASMILKAKRRRYEPIGGKEKNLSCFFVRFRESPSKINLVKSQIMSQTFRHPEILEIARREGKVTVEGLARHFDVTLQTIRRDLTDLADAGRLARVHGGAVLPSGTTNIDYEERRA